MPKLGLNNQGFSLLEVLLSIGILTICLSSLGYFWMRFHQAQIQLLAFDTSLTQAQNSLENAQAVYIEPTANLTVQSIGNGLQKATYQLNPTQRIEIVY